MKRLLQIMLCAVLFPKLSALADGSAHIDAPPVKAEIGEEQLVLLNISDNPGMMGFKLHFVYDAEKVKIIQAIKGTATNSGRFTDNIGLEEGSFDILWNSTENVYEDGSVAVLKIEPLDTDFIIDVSYSPADTFNESWDDVELVCSPVVSEGYEGGAVSEEAPESVPQTDSSPEITPTQTAEIISDVLEELPEKKLSEFSDSEKQKLLDRTNKELSVLYGAEENYYSTADELIADYKSVLKETLAEDAQLLETEKAAETLIGEFLNSGGFTEVNSENAAALNEALEQEGLERKYRIYLDDDDLAEVWSGEFDVDPDDYKTTESEGTSAGLSSQRADNSEKEMNNDTRTGLIAAAVAAAAAVAGAGIYFIIRRRKNN